MKLIPTLAVVVVASVGVLGLPEVAHACEMCFSGPSREAFAVTAGFLTLLPLGMVAGAGAWLRHEARRAELEENQDRGSQTDESSEG